MTAVAAAITVLMGAVFLVWLSRHVLITRQRRRAVLLTPDSPPAPPEAPAISVIVAARNEADNIGACLRCLLRQDYPRFDVVVCNDRSTDGTRAIVEEVAAGEERVRLVDIDRLPEGWYGKNHAVAAGAKASAGEWLCLIDADCRQTSPRTLSVAMRHALDTGADLLSVLPVLEAGGFWQRVMQPVCSGVMMVWFNPDRVNDPRKPTAYANGAFILIRREAYEAVGTHEAIRGEVMEDMHLARRVKHAGMALRVVQSRGLYTVRMYDSLREMLRGWCRIFFGSFASLGRLAASLALIVVMGLVPYAAAAAGLALAAAGVEPRGAWLVCGLSGVAGAAMQLSVVGRFYRLVGAGGRLAWTYALGCVLAGAAVVMAMWKLRAGARLTWRGTSYPARSGGG
jgi:cellulose synthase/poly-beta-1,6-N-acetylglucosamine synthase-like glycosyltransferase